MKNMTDSKTPSAKLFYPIAPIRRHEYRETVLQAGRPHS
jgi:hypothetical protein